LVWELIIIPALLPSISKSTWGRQERFAEYWSERL